MNAIILAAGIGSRFLDITKNNHKALLPIDGTPNIERTISYLLEFGITEIHIVTGHLDHLFYYLKNKYNCNLIFNKYYLKYNSIYSFFCAQHYFSDTLVIDADVVLLNNIFQKSSHSCYYLIQRPESNNNEWIPYFNEKGIVTKIMITNEFKPSLLGISYWVKKDCKIIKERLHEYLKKEELLIDPKLYWDDIPASSLKKLKIRTFIAPKNSAAEIDNMDNYQELWHC